MKWKVDLTAYCDRCHEGETSRAVQGGSRALLGGRSECYFKSSQSGCQAERGEGASHMDMGATVPGRKSSHCLTAEPHQCSYRA